MKLRPHKADSPKIRFNLSKCPRCISPFPHSSPLLVLPFVLFPFLHPSPSLHSFLFPSPNPSYPLRPFPLIPSNARPSSSVGPSSLHLLPIQPPLSSLPSLNPLLAPFLPHPISLLPLLPLLPSLPPPPSKNLIKTRNKENQQDSANLADMSPTSLTHAPPLPLSLSLDTPLSSPGVFPFSFFSNLLLFSPPFLLYPSFRFFFLFLFFSSISLPLRLSLPTSLARSFLFLFYTSPFSSFFPYPFLLSPFII